MHALICVYQRVCMHIYVHRCSHFRRCLPTCCFACKTSLRLLLPSNWWCVCAERAREGADQGRESKRAQERERKRKPARAKERARSCARKRVSVFEFLDNVMCSCLGLSLMRFGSCVSVRAFLVCRSSTMGLFTQRLRLPPVVVHIPVYTYIFFYTHTHT